MPRTGGSSCRQVRKFSDVRWVEPELLKCRSLTPQRSVRKHMSTLVSTRVQKLFGNLSSTRVTSDTRTRSGRRPMEATRDRHTMDERLVSELPDFEVFVACVMMIDGAWHDPAVLAYRDSLLTDAWKAFQNMARFRSESEVCVPTASVEIPGFSPHPVTDAVGEEPKSPKSQTQTHAPVKSNQQKVEKARHRADKSVPRITESSVSIEESCHKDQQVGMSHEFAVKTLLDRSHGSSNTTKYWSEPCLHIASSHADGEPMHWRLTEKSNTFADSLGSHASLGLESSDGIYAPWTWLDDFGVGMKRCLR